MAVNQRLGLLGHAISYSLSPKIHQFASQQLGIPCSYELFDLAAENVPAFLAEFWHAGGQGLNITKPHKRLVAQLVGSPLASINTLYRGQRGWLAASTDGEGFARAIGRLGRPYHSFRKWVFLGAGGATSAILLFLADTHLDVVILRRSPRHDAELQRLCPRVRFLPFTPEALEDELAPHHSSSLIQIPAVPQLTLLYWDDRPLRHPSDDEQSEEERPGSDSRIELADTLLIQATNAPEQGDDLASFCPALREFGGTLVDLIYARPSALFSFARERGISCQDGLPMLIEQARLAQELWWGKSAAYEEIRNVLEFS